MREIDQLDHRVEEWEWSERLVEAWHRSTPEQRVEGAEWYPRALATAVGLAEEHGHGVDTAVGVIAALSPRCYWSDNLRRAERALRGEPRGFRPSVEACHRIMGGESPLDVLRGPKVRAFHSAIMGDPDSAVIDVWMMRAMGREPKSPKGREYDRAATALRIAARRVGAPVRDVQATVWIVTRGGGE